MKKSLCNISLVIVILSVNIQIFAQEFPNSTADPRCDILRELNTAEVEYELYFNGYSETLTDLVNANLIDNIPEGFTYFYSLLSGKKL